MRGEFCQAAQKAFGQTLGNGEGQRSLVCYSPWGRKELDNKEDIANVC